jgi:hypothetical protein
VFPVPLAVTVMTRVALPVEYCSGSAMPRRGAGLGLAGGGFGAAGVVLAGACLVGFGGGAADVDAWLVGGAACTVCVAAGCVAAGWVLLGGALDARALLGVVATIRGANVGVAGSEVVTGAVTGSVNSAAGLLLPARLIPTATTAQPATAAVAASEETIRPSDM